MYTITYATHFNDKYEINVIDKDLMECYFITLSKATDLKFIHVTDGLTGEIIHSIVDGKITILNGKIID